MRESCKNACIETESFVNSPSKIYSVQQNNVKNKATNYGAYWVQPENFNIWNHWSWKYRLLWNQFNCCKVVLIEMFPKTSKMRRKEEFLEQ